MNAVAARQRIAAGLREAGVEPGGVALVHSSLSSLGHVPDGAETVVGGLLEALGAEGTLLMPALSYEHVHAGQSRFDVRRTPANIGAIPEYFRTRSFVGERVTGRRAREGRETAPLFKPECLLQRLRMLPYAPGPVPRTRR